MEEVIIVDENDKEIGTMEKLEAHRIGVLHRAISVIIINSKGELLLQRRALSKYHSPGLWTNTCCSHPKPNEATDRAAARRLKEEMGLTAALSKIYEFTYWTEFENGLIESEYDHVYIGLSDVLPIINKDEADDFKYISLNDLENDMKLNPNSYTIWFKLIIEEAGKKINKVISEFISI